MCLSLKSVGGFHRLHTRCAASDGFGAALRLHVLGNRCADGRHDGCSQLTLYRSAWTRNSNFKEIRHE
jgi:hypothetical protein